MRRKLLFVVLVTMIAVTIQAETKSVRRAAFMSLVLPGSGEVYTERYKKATFFLSTEVIIWMSYGYFNTEVDNAIDSYKMYAEQYAGSNFNESDEYFQTMHDYYSWDEFNQDIERRARNYYLLYKNDPAEYQKYLDNNLMAENTRWEWEDKGKWIKFKEMRKDKQNLKIMANFMIAAALLNRVVSTIDAVASSKRFNASQNKTSRIYVKPDLKKRGLRLHYEIKF